MNRVAKLNELSAELDAYQEKNGLPKQCADEQLHELRAHCEYLRGFCERWILAEDAEL